METPDPKKKRRKKGERKDGLIQKSVMIGRKKDGSPDRKYFYGHTIAEAERQKQAYLQRMAYGMDAVYENMTVSEWVDKWYDVYVLNAKRLHPLSESAKAGYRSRIKQLKCALGDKRMRDVREMDLQQALDHVNGQSKDVASKYAGMIKRVFKRAKSNKIIMDNPAECLETPEGTKGKHRALQRWEADLILHNWRVHPAGMWAMVMMLTGMRRGELAAQNWDNIDLENRRITICEAASVNQNKGFTVVNHTKSPAGMRTLPICSALMEVLESIPTDKRTGMLCVTTKGQPISPTSFRCGWNTMKKYMWRIHNGKALNQEGRRTDVEKKKGIKSDNANTFDWRAHDLRFTFATAMYDAGVPVKAAQYYMGHADIRLTLDLYTTLSAEREKESNIQLVTFLDNWLTKNTAAPWEGDLMLNYASHGVELMSTPDFAKKISR